MCQSAIDALCLRVDTLCEEYGCVCVCVFQQYASSILYYSVYYIHISINDYYQWYYVMSVTDVMPMPADKQFLLFACILFACHAYAFAYE